MYNPKAFILHAASRDQAFAHCLRFPVAASRRSRARVSVPLWLANLSAQLPVEALVGHYPTNKLMGREPLLQRAVMPFHLTILCGISSAFAELFPTKGYVLTRYSPVCHSRPKPVVRLACLRRAASVHPEPGSNSPKKLE